MPQVLPEVYDYDTKSPKVPVYTGPSGGLCGRLALLIGMAAFSAAEDQAEACVSRCFMFGEWLRHNFEIGIGSKYTVLLVFPIVLLLDRAELISYRIRKSWGGCEHLS
jgi:hypothetical protein